MRGIIYKDLYDNFLIWKNLASYLFGVAAILVSVVLLPDSEYYFILLILMLNFIGSCAMEASVEQDDASNFNRLLISFPVTKKEIVIARYILALIFIAVSNLLGLGITVIHVLIGGALGFREAFSIWLLGLCVSLIFAGISYIGYISFGKRKGTWLFIFLVVVIATGYGSMSAIYGIEQFVQMDKTLLLCTGFPVSVLVFALSCMISIEIYKRKFF